MESDILDREAERPEEYIRRFPASVFQRILHFWIDLVSCLLFALFMQTGSIWLFKVTGWINPLARLTSIPMLLSYVSLYFFLFEGLFARTPAKWITRTRVVNRLGRRPNILAVLGRSLLRLVPGEGLLVFFAGSRPLHDRLTNTYVIQDLNRAQRERARTNESGQADRWQAHRFQRQYHLARIALQASPQERQHQVLRRPDLYRTAVLQAAQDLQRQHKTK